MTLNRASPDSPRRLPTPGEAEVKKKTQQSLQELGQKFEQQRQQKTVGAFVHRLQEQIRNLGCVDALERAMRSVQNISGHDDIRGEWESRLQTLHYYATTEHTVDGTTGDPISVQFFIINPGLTEKWRLLDSLATASGNASLRTAADEINRAVTAFANAVAQERHPAVIGPYSIVQTRNDELHAREANLLQVATFGAAGTIATGALILNFFAKPEDRNMKLVIGYGLVAALAAGWGTLTTGADEQLRNEIRFLVEPRGPRGEGPSWEDLQTRYSFLRTPQGSQFTRNLYDTTDTNVLDALGNAGRLTPEQRKAVLALAQQSGIRDDSVQRMIDSTGEREPGRDFRAFVSLIQQAGSSEARTIVTRYIASGSTRRDLENRTA